MSAQLESALVLQLVDSIKWSESLGPETAAGDLKSVDLDAPLDVRDYGRRDRELAYRDLINAAAVLKVSLETETVWNAAAIRPKLQGLTTHIMPNNTGDYGQVDSQVVHVKNSSIPKDALDTDKDLTGRDALVYEVLARACQVFEAPPISPNDSSGSVVPGVSAWSLGEASETRQDINQALPLNRELFKQPDRRLAHRDNLVAAYAANLIQVIKNPFAFANRIYVKFVGASERELEIYSAIRIYFQSGKTYLTGQQVYHSTGWWEAETITGDTPGTTGTWKSITEPTLRVFAAEPAFTDRNRIVYHTANKTLQWLSESGAVVHTPQIVALSIPGAIPGQTITTVPAIPAASDAQFWRQKAGQITYEGTLTQHIEGYHDSSVLQSGVVQTDTTGFTAPNAIRIPFDTPLLPSNKYRVSSLVKPSQTAKIYGSHNTIGLSGTLNGVTFTGAYAPADLTTPGTPIEYQLTLPEGSWLLSLDYTNLGSTTTGFGTKIRWNGSEILEDAAPLLFQDAAGVQYPAGRLVESNPVAFITTGGQSTLDISWTYGDGQFHVRTLNFLSTDVRIGRYSMQVDLQSGNVSYLPTSGTEIPAIDSYGEKNIYGVMPFEFSVTGTAISPEFVLNWLPTEDQLPLQVRQVQLERVVRLEADPSAGGFASWKQECLNRAEKSIRTAFNTYLRQVDTEDIPEFTLDGTLWDKDSTDNWMSTIETYHPRLREIQDVDTIVDNRQYIVSTGSVVYDSGTYLAGEKFFGTTATTFTQLYDNGRLDQVGAFTLSFPGHIGKPALVPLGLYFDNVNIEQANPTIRQVPTVMALQPWMIEAGIYVAQPEFWSPDTIPTGLEAAPEVLDRYPDTINVSTGFREGQLDAVVFDHSVATSSAIWTGVVASAVIDGSAGTHESATTMEPWFGTVVDVVISGTGTQSGTSSVEIWTGTVATVVEVGSGGTHSGTVSLEIWSGSLATSSISGGDYYEDGTLSMGFYTGAYV
ncbi:MAG: hypothetical protein ACYSUV_02005 [Planctomycetota bacterium]|jgi:hypothetical protein